MGELYPRDESRGKKASFQDFGSGNKLIKKAVRASRPTAFLISGDLETNAAPQDEQNPVLKGHPLTRDANHGTQTPTPKNPALKGRRDLREDSMPLTETKMDRIAGISRPCQPTPTHAPCGGLVFLWGASFSKYVTPSGSGYRVYQRFSNSWGIHPKNTRHQNDPQTKSPYLASTSRGSH
ncbi:MAG TPA: hypothetical protein DIW47_11885, partial [Bacteroidetes bacterium]|nr:hypothetical protein [Bacteroidota bacterium]